MHGLVVVGRRTACEIDPAQGFFPKAVRAQNPGRNPAEKRAAVMCRSRQSALGIQPEENQ
jgi:hypothetical protein